QAIQMAMASVGRNMARPSGRQIITQQRSFSSHSTMWKFSAARRERSIGLSFAAKMGPSKFPHLRAGRGNFLVMRERGSTMRAVLVAGFLLATATCDAFYIRL